MASHRQNRIFIFALENNHVESNIHKGFWPNISGSIEHTELLTLFDVKNAFGEVHHNLIKTVLEYHHIPPSIISLINSLYSGYFILITTKDFITNPIKVNRGVVQGDCLAPLIFNLCVNTLIKSIENEKVGCLGYVLEKILSPRHWFQFADDTAIITVLEGGN